MRSALMTRCRMLKWRVKYRCFTHNRRCLCWDCRYIHGNHDEAGGWE